MNDNEVVISLLDYYKKKGIDLYKIIDDPMFKSLSRDTKIKAIQMYADRISQGTPATLNKNDFKSTMKQMLFRAGIGAVTGGIAGLGFARAFNDGKVPAEAFAAGAIFGATGGLLHSLGSSASNIADRLHMRKELNIVASEPTPQNAFNVLIANNIRGGKTKDFKDSTQEVLNESLENLKNSRKDQLKAFVDHYNRSIGNEPV
jgi:uncharacterized membrane protein